MIAPCIPSEFGGQAMILMPIVQPVSDDNIRVDLSLQFFEIALHIGVLRWKKPIPEVCNDDLSRGRARKQCARTATRLCGSDPLRAEDNPSHVDCWHTRQPSENGSAAANLKVVAMRADAQQPQRLAPADFRY
jgi:hypothetical protein